jgi:hypothetical protein
VWSGSRGTIQEILKDTVEVAYDMVTTSPRRDPVQRTAPFPDYMNSTNLEIIQEAQALPEWFIGRTFGRYTPGTRVRLKESYQSDDLEAGVCVHPGSVGTVMGHPYSVNFAVKYDQKGKQSGSGVERDICGAVLERQTGEEVADRPVLEVITESLRHALLGARSNDGISMNQISGDGVRGLYESKVCGSYRKLTLLMPREDQTFIASVVLPKDSTVDEARIVSGLFASYPLKDAFQKLCTDTDVVYAHLVSVGGKGRVDLEYN